MKSLKKLLAIMLAFCMAFTMLACGTDEEETEAEATTSAETSEDEELNDDSTTSTSPYLDGNGLLNDTDGFYTDVKALDIVTLADYSKITVPYDSYYLSDDDLQTQLDSIIESNTTTKQITDRAVKDGDTVHIVYTGYVNDIAFTGGTTGEDGADLVIGSGTYIDDFEEQIIGHKPGETFDVNVTFPDSYPNNTDLEGQDATFTTSLEYISETVTPEMNDAFVAEVYGESKGWSTVDELKAGLRESYKATAANDYVTQYLVDNSTIKEVPEVCSEYSKKYFEWKIALICANNNTDTTTYLANYGYSSIDEYYEACADDVNSQISQDLIFQAICEKEGLTPTVKDFEDFLKDYYGEDNYASAYSNFNELMSASAIMHNMISIIALEKIEPNIAYASK